MQLKYHMVTIEDLVPAEHFLRKLEVALDLSFVYEETAHLYSRRYGRPPIDPAVRRQQRISLVSRDRSGRTSAGSQHDQLAAASEACVSEGVPPSV